MLIAGLGGRWLLSARVDTDESELIEDCSDVMNVTFLCTNAVRSSSTGIFRPRCAFNENLAVRRHPGFGGAVRSLDQELYTHDLLHALIAKVGVFRRERGFRIDPRNVRVDGDFRVRIEIDMRRL